MPSNQFWEGFILGALLVLCVFLAFNHLARAGAKK